MKTILFLGLIKDINKQKMNKSKALAVYKDVSLEKENIARKMHDVIKCRF